MLQFSIRKTKRAEFSISVLGGIILSLIGLAILLLGFYNLNITGNIDREVCHDSVILRGTVTNAFNAQSLVPLNCKTEKICVQGDKLFGRENCEDEFYNAEGIKKVKVDDKVQIERLISQEMVDCWSMMGEGKLSLFSDFYAERYGLGSVYPTCVICSRIAFDEKSLEEVGLTSDKLSEVDILNYMQNYKIPTSEMSYYEYLTSQDSKISADTNVIDKEKLESSFSSEMSKLIEEWSEEAELSEEEKTELKEMTKIPFLSSEDSAEEAKANEIGILFMQISSPKQVDSLKNIIQDLGNVFIGGAFIAPAATYQIGKTVVKNPVILAVLSLAGIAQQANVYYQRDVTAGYCGDISVGDSARNGCSVVRTVTYDNVDELLSYCSVIESIS